MGVRVGLVAMAGCGVGRVRLVEMVVMKLMLFVFAFLMPLLAA